MSTSNRTEKKLVILGDSSVGKSSILLRYTQNEFSEEFEVTIGGAFLQVEAELEDGSKMTLDVWDTAGQERYKSLMHLYYRQASAALIVFDLSNHDSFERCEYWIDRLKSQEPDCMLFLVGNKADLPNWQVDEQMAQELAEKHECDFFKTSAKLGDNVKVLFTNVAEAIRNKNKAAK